MFSSSNPIRMITSKCSVDSSTKLSQSVSYFPQILFISFSEGTLGLIKLPTYLNYLLFLNRSKYQNILSQISHYFIWILFLHSPSFLHPLATAIILLFSPLLQSYRENRLCLFQYIFLESLFYMCCISVIFPLKYNPISPSIILI